MQSSESPGSSRNGIWQNGTMTSVPSQTGMIASTFSMPGTVVRAEDLPEMIPGQPDPPFSQTPVNPNFAMFPNQSSQNQPAQNQSAQNRSAGILPEQDIPPVSSETNPGSAARNCPSAHSSRCAAVCGSTEPSDAAGLSGVYQLRKPAVP